MLSMISVDGIVQSDLVKRCNCAVCHATAVRVMDCEGKIEPASTNMSVLMYVHTHSVKRCKHNVCHAIAVRVVDCDGETAPHTYNDVCPHVCVYSQLERGGDVLHAMHVQ